MYYANPCATITVDAVVIRDARRHAQMEANRFDFLARSLTLTGTRRRAVGGLVAGALGLLVSQAEETAAKKRKGKKRKKKGSGSRSRSRSGSGSHPTTCPGGYSNCGEQCVDLRDNTQHCGACSTVCSPGKSCCNGVCANLQDDDNHCAACGHRCRTTDRETPQVNAAEICSNGACLECTLEGFIDQGKPPRCCRGLTQCPPKGALPARCFPADRPCP
jgi:hypothetical protein